MKDRVPKYPGRVKLTHVSGDLYDMVRADEPTQEGTPLNKSTLLKDETAKNLGIDPATNPTVDDALQCIVTGQIVVTTEAGNTVTIQNGDIIFSGIADSDGVAVLSPTKYGTWTVTVTKGDRSFSTTVNVDASKQYLITLSSTPIYGVQWDGTSTSKWTRINNAINFADPVPYVAGASNYSSPFDAIQPWAGMVKSERTGGTMVAIPKFWYKLEQVGAGMKIQIAGGPVKGFSVSPAHMDRGDGRGERSVVYIGRYHCGATAYKSVTGQMPKVRITRSATRTAIHNLGSNIWQMDFAMRFTIWLLYIVEFADWHSQKKIGYGCGNNSGVQTMGASDSMSYHTGTMQTDRTTDGVGVQYRWIEGPWDNCCDWLDGCYYNSNGINVIKNPANFSDSANGTLLGKPSNGYPSAFSVTSAGGFPAFYPTAASGSDSTYSCDFWSFGASNPCLYVGGNYSRNASQGLFCVGCEGTSYSLGYIGARLMELP